MIQAAKNESPYMNPYLGGIGIGVILFSIFFIAGKGLGASGALTRLFTFTLDSIAPTYVSGINYLNKYATSESGPLYHWLFFMFIGILIGGLFAGIRGNRLTSELFKGPNTTNRRRIITAFAGGVLTALGARLAGGCTSGLALTGASILGVSGWVFFLSVFAAGLATAFVVRKEWL
jgi:uncharacterized membrane protein YedE/YeeE